MKLDEAIEIKEANFRGDEPDDPIDLIIADTILIEAGKREKSNRENPDFIMVGKLPSETEE